MAMGLINGVHEQGIPPDDRGLAYGDGVFRTLRSVAGVPLHWRKQFNKLADDCARLGIPCPPATLLLPEVRAAARTHAHAVVKIIVTRGSGARGYRPPVPCEPLRIVDAAALPAAPPVAEGITARLCQLRLAHQPALAGVKHLNRLENVLARAEWNDPAIREGLLLDQQGHVIGGTMSNLFIVEQRRLLTPALDRCGVAGVTRSRVMALAETAGIACEVEDLDLPRVLDADEVFFVNSVFGLWPLAQLDNRRWQPALVAREIAQALANEDRALV
jgi:4-amino-4-deoxychorismate lyase